MIKKIIIGAGIIGGLVLAGAECDMAVWPWVNIAGLGVFCGSLGVAAIKLKDEIKG